MRLTLSLLAAVGLHGALFGLAAAVLSRPAAQHLVRPAVELEVEVIAAKPDPPADAAPTQVPAASSARPKLESSRARPARHVRPVALVGSSTPTPLDGLVKADVPAVPAVATPRSSAPGTAGRPSTIVMQGGGAVVSAQPRYHTNPKPDYPIPSLRRREEGIVLLNVQVQADGTPAAISLNRGCGHPLLDRAALDAVRRWTFEPARAAGVPVSSLVVIPVRFSLEDP
jgi:periplasmic protein TonB